MKRKIRVGLFGISLESVNYGVTALALTQLAMLKRIETECDTTVECLVFADDSEEAVARVKALLQIEEIVPKYIVRFKTGIRGLLNLRKDIQSCDFVIDLTYGDSFSDIYGGKKFLLYSFPKIIAIQTKTPLVLAPQTIGPFYKKWVKQLGTYLLSHSDYIFARDRLSLECAAQLTNRTDLVETSDLAMQLPYEKKANENYVEGKLNVGLNVSSLLWEQDSSNLALSLSYRELTERTIALLVEKGCAVHLIAHVYDEGAFTEYTLAEQLSAEYGNLIVAPSFTDPIDAKNYLSGLDCFIGARMHATIGAFSSGVPVIPIAYSRKFEGLYGTLGYDHCIDCTTETVESAEEKISAKLDALDTLERDRALAFAKANEKMEIYYQCLKQLCIGL